MQEGIGVGGEVSSALSSAVVMEATSAVAAAAAAAAAAGAASAGMAMGDHLPLAQYPATGPHERAYQHQRGAADFGHVHRAADPRQAVEADESEDLDRLVSSSQARKDYFLKTKDLEGLPFKLAPPAKRKPGRPMHCAPIRRPPPVSPCSRNGEPQTLKRVCWRPQLLPSLDRSA